MSEHGAAVSKSLTTAQNVIGCSATLTASDPYSQINYRSMPSLSGRRLGYGLVGDRLTILDTSLAPNGYTWYKVRFEMAPYAEGWIRGDFVRRQGDCTTNQEPDETIRQDQEENSHQEREVDEGGGTAADQQFNRSEINYFLEVALGSEYGNSTTTVKRWGDDICIQLNFPEQENISRRAEDTVRSTVDDVVTDINGYFKDISDSLDDIDSSVTRRNDNWEPIEIGIAGENCDNPNIELYYVQAENFQQYDSNARRGQVGHVWTWWSRNEINRARILISSNYLTEDERDHVIREEITQSLGILKDSWNYPTSIFYQGWTSVTRFDPIDEAVIKMLYHPAINPGMAARDAEVKLSQLQDVSQDKELCKHVKFRWVVADMQVIYTLITACD